MAHRYLDLLDEQVGRDARGQRADLVAQRAGSVVKRAGVRGLADQRHPRHQRQAGRIGTMCAMELRAHEVRDRIRRGVAAIDLHAGPAHHVELHALEPGHLPILDRHDHCPLGAGLSDRATLDVAGEHDVGFLADHLELVNMAERPVLVAARLQVLEAAGRVVLVPPAPGERGVQHADVERMRVRRRVAERQVVGDGRGGEALAVHGHRESGQPVRFGALGPE